MASVEVPTEVAEDGTQQTRFRSAIPRHRLPVLVALVASRLKDKSSLVRKDAIRLMTILLTRNPYVSFIWHVGVAASSMAQCF
jgi:hypothetical protein